MRALDLTLLVAGGFVLLTSGCLRFGFDDDDPGGEIGDSSVADASPPPPQRRVTGSLALFLFDELSGTLVFDRSLTEPPLDLAFDGSMLTRKENALAFGGSGRVSSREPARKIVEACQRTEEVTVEAWVAPVREFGFGGERILAISDGSTLSNLTLTYGWEASPTSTFFHRLRTTSTDLTGGPSAVESPPITGVGVTHILFAHDALGRERIYVDGVARLLPDRPGGFGNWDPTHRFALADDPGGGRPWLGELHMVALYARALTQDEATRNFRAGPDPELSGRMGDRADGALMLFDFSEGSGDTVLDSAGTASRYDLSISDPQAVRWLEGALDVQSPTRIDAQSQGRSPLHDACTASGELTVEVWVRPQRFLQGGPARVVTLGKDVLSHSLMLGQGRDGGPEAHSFALRLRTIGSDLIGRPAVETSSVSVHRPLTHVVFTHGSAGQEFSYVNGVPTPEATRAGNFSTWDASYHLYLGGDPRDATHSYLGDLHLVAIYDRALTPSDVQQNYLAGPDPER